jgi:hypothetical protein
VDLSGWSLLENGVAHKLQPPASGSLSVAAGGYAVIADRPELFSADYPSAPAPVDSAFSLSNSGERVALVSPAGAEISAIEWTADSGAADGKSWQRVGESNSFVSAAATPGRPNADREEAAAPGQGAQDAKSAAPVSAHSATPGLSKVSRPPELSIDAGRNRTVPVGAEIQVDPESSGSERVSFSWSWGDGSVSRGRRGEHRYLFPGEYALVLNAKSSAGAVAVSRALVTVVAPEVSVSSEPGDGGFVSVRNLGSAELNLGGFYLDAVGDSYELPHDTIALPNGTVTVPNAVSGLDFSASGDVGLRRPDGRAVATGL